MLRRINCAAVLGAIRDAGSARVAELVEATGLSRPTVTAAVSELLADGWIEEVDAAGDDLPRMGRPARVLRFRAGARHVLGIDVGPHKIYCALADLDGRVIADLRDDAQMTSHAQLMAHVESAIGLVLAEAAVPRSSLAAAGVGTPGVVDEPFGRVVTAPSVPGGSFIELGELLRRSLPCPVHVENDVNLAVIAERWLGAGRDADSLVLVHWGARLGAAVLVDGRLHRGAHGAAGEIGFIDLDEEPQGIPPEGLGPLERAVGTGWILARARALGDAGGTDAVAVLERAAAGDATVLAVVDEACARFVRGLAPFLAAVDPQLVILGGSITLAGQAVLAGVRHHLGRRALVVPRLELTSLGEDAVALGAIRLALTDVEERLLHVPGVAP
ncbi:MAG TPA: ROK family transcriptional regulator [Euzebya sp.]|nr:ROK family transcriptional regulator [Euzebya sp.]